MVGAVSPSLEDDSGSSFPCPKYDYNKPVYCIIQYCIRAAVIMYQKLGGLKATYCLGVL